MAASMTTPPALRSTSRSEISGPAYSSSSFVFSLLSSSAEGVPGKRPENDVTNGLISCVLQCNPSCTLFNPHQRDIRYRNIAR